MARGDELDLILADPRLTSEDWSVLADAAGVTNLPDDQESRRETISRKIRHHFGHTILNRIRDAWSPDYRPIVVGAAGRLKVNISDSAPVSEIEYAILVKLVSLVRQQIIKEKGEEAWTDIEQRVRADVEEQVAKGSIPPEFTDILRGVGPGMLVAALAAGRFAGFGLYIIVNQLFFQLARAVGWKIGVGVAGVVIGRTLALALGPWGWVASGIWALYDLGSTNWQRTIVSVAVVAALRLRLSVKAIPVMPSSIVSIRQMDEESSPRTDEVVVASAHSIIEFDLSDVQMLLPVLLPGRNITLTRDWNSTVLVTIKDVDLGKLVPDFDVLFNVSARLLTPRILRCSLANIRGGRGSVDLLATMLRGVGGLEWLAAQVVGPNRCTVDRGLGLIDVHLDRLDEKLARFLTEQVRLHEILLPASGDILARIVFAPLPRCAHP